MSIEPYLSDTPLHEGDLAALDHAFGFDHAAIGLTREQKAEQEEKLRPYMVHARTRAVRAARLRGSR